jgi:hypothetical protein
MRGGGLRDAGREGEREREAGSGTARLSRYEAANR